MKKAARGAGVPDPEAKGKPDHGAITAHQPTLKSRKRVKMLASLGFSHEEIGLLQDLDDKTLARHYAKELKVGALEADAEVLGNLFRLATQTKDLNVASRNSIFWAKVRRRWHEVQRVIHGFDPETIQMFVKNVVQLLRREIPAACPHCKTKLDLGPRIAAELHALSAKMAEVLPPSEVIAMPVPKLASDGFDDAEKEG